MAAFFHDMMHKEMELYVDDMIAKSKTNKAPGRFEKKKIWTIEKIWSQA